MVISIVEPLDILGLTEVQKKLTRHTYTVQVCSDECEYLKISSKNFREKLLNKNEALQQRLKLRCKDIDKLHQGLNEKKVDFKRQNDEILESVAERFSKEQGRPC